MVKRGLFVVLEGSEGAGKSTAREYMKDFLCEHGKDVIVTREPGGTQLGEELRTLLLSHQQNGMSIDAEALMMFAARAEHLDKVIKPALAAGKWVLCDRFTSSTYAYQSGGRDVPFNRIAVLEEWVQGSLRPDMTVVMDIDVKVGLERAGKRGAPDRFEKEKIDFFERVRASYLEQAHCFSDRFAVVDASCDIAGVQRQLCDVIGKML